MIQNLIFLQRYDVLQNGCSGPYPVYLKLKPKRRFFKLDFAKVAMQKCITENGTEWLCPSMNVSPSIIGIIWLEENIKPCTNDIYAQYTYNTARKYALCSTAASMVYNDTLEWNSISCGSIKISVASNSDDTSTSTNYILFLNFKLTQTLFHCSWIQIPPAFSSVVPDIHLWMQQSVSRRTAFNDC